jgi:hypothetical protein
MDAETDYVPTAVRRFQRGDWVRQFYPPQKARDKLNARYVGPYLVLGRVGEVNYRVQRNQNADPLVVHVDHLKESRSETPPVSWLTDARDNDKSCQTEAAVPHPRRQNPGDDTPDASDADPYDPDIDDDVAVGDMGIVGDALASNVEALPRPRRSGRVRRPPKRFGDEQ